MHEDPQVPNYGEPGKGPLLEPGMVFAIEPMVNAGGPEVRLGDDNWAVYSADGSLAAHFEFTVAVDRGRPADPHPLAPLATSNRRMSRATVPIFAGGLRRNLTHGADRRSRRARCCPRPRRRRSIPYGTNDAGGFRNVLPPGEAGVDNVTQLGSFLTTGALPSHWDDQQPLYDGLVAASAAKGFGMPEVEQYYKDADLRRPGGGVESTISPRPGVTIVRDSAYGVPHVYGVTRDDVMFGAGYVNAADRLFLMDILRHTGRAAALLVHRRLALQPGDGPSPVAVRPVYGGGAAGPGRQRRGALRARRAQPSIADVRGYVDGINAYINEALADPSKLPAEYAALGKVPEPWTITDTVAEASLIGGIFGKGGGRELDSALTMQEFVGRFGKRAGRRAWSDFRSRNDRRRRRPWRSASRTRPAARSPSGASRSPTRAPSPTRPWPAASTSPRLARAPSGFGRHRRPDWRSRWRTRATPPTGSSSPPPSRRPAIRSACSGPQVGYYQPQILMEMDLHGPGIDARGATFPGVGLYVLLGHGRDYAWSATTATSDNVDTFAEVLCQDDFHYRYKGQCLAMEKLERTNTGRRTGRHTEPGIEDADRLPDRSRDRLRPRHDRRQGGRLRASPAPPTSTRPTRRSSSAA